MLAANQWAIVAGVIVLVTGNILFAQQPKKVVWERGEEARVDDSAAGTDGHFLVYVPADYDSREKWPVIFYYHGLGGRPETRCIRRIANGKYCIVVGMSYYAPGMEGYRFLETEDVRILHHVLAAIKERLNVNDKRLYVAGFSKGGFYTCDMLRLLGDMLAGGIVLGAGSKSLDSGWPALTGMEIFIGCGEQDAFLATAKATEKHLATLGATVTFEQWPEVGHSIGDIAGLRRWLFEQTVDRPCVDPMPGNLEDPCGASPPRAAGQDDFWPQRLTWVAVAALLIGFVAGGIVLVRRRRETKLRKATSQSREEAGEP